MRRLVFLLTLIVAAASCTSQDIDFSRSIATRGFADTIINNGQIITVDENFAIAESVAIKDVVIVGVGSQSEVRTWRGPRTREINVGGRTVIPGLIDSHIHATAAGVNWNAELHWEQSRSLADGLNQIASAVKQKPA